MNRSEKCKTNVFWQKWNVYILDFCFNAYNKKIVARLLFELAPLLSQWSVSRKDFNIPLGIGKATGTFSRASRAHFISVSWVDEANLAHFLQ